MLPLQALHEKWLRKTLGHLQHDNLVSNVSPLLPDEAASILDIGCGNGLFSCKLMSAKPNLRISGVETLPRDGCLIDCETFNGGALPFPDSSFDHVLLINVLHHADNPEQLLAEARRVTR